MEVLVEVVDKVVVVAVAMRVVKVVCSVVFPLADVDAISVDNDFLDMRCDRVEVTTGKEADDCKSAVVDCNISTETKISLGKAIR